MTRKLVPLKQLKCIKMALSRQEVAATFLQAAEMKLTHLAKALINQDGFLDDLWHICSIKTLRSPLSFYVDPRYRDASITVAGDEGDEILVHAHTTETVPENVV
ncbi:hypothetical protein VE00_10346 [Pseudogymnoascus sp. WSF 3629]|nr:hypothetical protein VE00_10346 [Pseudogymnoascus sp. WSF 3629]